MTDKAVAEFSSAWRLFLSDEVLNDREQLLAAFLHIPSVGLAVCDRELRFQAVNQALAEMNGIPPQEHLGKTVREVMGEMAEHVEPVFQQVFESGETFGLSAASPTRKERGHWIESCFPIRDAGGRVKHVGAIVVDVTQQKMLEQSLRNLTSRYEREEERLAILLEMSTALMSHRDVAATVPRDFEIHPQNHWSGFRLAGAA